MKYYITISLIFFSPVCFSQRMGRKLIGSAEECYRIDSIVSAISNTKINHCFTSMSSIHDKHNKITYCYDKNSRVTEISIGIDHYYYFRDSLIQMVRSTINDLYGSYSFHNNDTICISGNCSTSPNIVFRKGYNLLIKAKARLKPFGKNTIPY